MKIFYHGSKTEGITCLEAQSRLHDSDKTVVYLTDSVPYALLYIWDGEKLVSGVKHVTARMKAGITYYEEQFPEQLKAFYDGVSGYIYTLRSDAAYPVDKRDNMFYMESSVAIAESVCIPNVYEELLKYESRGELVVLRYNEQPKKRQEQLTELIATAIVRNGFYERDDVQRLFMQKYFSEAWKTAERQKNADL